MMKSILAALALLLIAAPAGAFQLCPTFKAGWAKSYAGIPISSVSYDPTTQLLYVVWNYTEATAYWPVPTSIIQTFSQSKDPMGIYNSYVKSTYSALFLSEKDNCPILQENSAYIWTTPTAAHRGNIMYALFLQGGGPLEIAKGVSLWLNFTY